MNGILGVNIPFSDHNQSPRNCYQCLNEYENVMLSNGNMKMIKDIQIGDEITCFNPKSIAGRNCKTGKYFFGNVETKEEILGTDSIYRKRKTQQTAIG
jgi:hypothetical protein